MNANLRLVKILLRGALIALLSLSLLLVVFSLFSGAADQGGGLAGLWKNSPNSFPWLVLLVLVALAWRNRIVGGVLVALAGLILTYFFNFRGQNFFLSTFVVCMLIFLLGLVVVITAGYIRAVHRREGSGL